MPCNSDYLEPTQREKELQRAATLLVYLRNKTGKKPEVWAVNEASNQYATDERSVTELCAALKALEPKARDAIVYNARDKTARDLANWWEEHQAADAKREKEEAAERDRQKAKKGGLAKLTRRQRKALGL